MSKRKKKAQSNLIPSKETIRTVKDEKSQERVKEMKRTILNWMEKPNQTYRFFFSIIWLYIALRILFTDVDLQIFSKYFSIQKTNYIISRCLLTLTLILLYWYIVKSNVFFKQLGWLIIFPIYPIGFNLLKFIFWIIPNYLIKKEDHFIIYSYIDFLISFFVQIRYKLTILLLFIISVFLLFTLKSQYLYIPMVLFVFLQANHLYRRYQETFSPVKIFQMKIDNFIPNPDFSKVKFDKDLDKAAENKPTGIESQIAKMEYFLLIGEFSKALNHKINLVLNSKSYFKSFIFKALYSFLFSMIIFGCLNYLLFKIDSTNYKYEGNPKYFEFFYYSFFTIFPDGSDIEPITRFSKSIRMIGVTVGVLINLLILTVLITVKSERYKENLQLLNKWAYSHSTEISKYFEEKYGQKTADGLKFLIDSGSEIAKVMKKLKDLIREI